MASSAVTELVERQHWLDSLADRLAPAVSQAFASADETGQRVKDALHGVWLGHPLHPVLTDIPVGAWTAALALDAAEAQTGDPGVGRAADLAVAVGLAGAVGSAVTGLTDWSETNGASRRLGMAHALFNVSATTCYVLSLVIRNRRDRSAGRAYALGGYALAMAGAYLGGSLVYDRQIGVNHAANEEVPDEFTRVVPEGDLVEGTPRRADVAGTPVLLVRQHGRIHAMADRCAHQGGPLSEGRLGDGTITCPWHGSTYDLDTGDVVTGPSTYPQPCFDARVREGFIEVRAARRS